MGESYGDEFYFYASCFTQGNWNVYDLRGYLKLNEPSNRRPLIVVNLATIPPIALQRIDRDPKKDFIFRYGPINEVTLLTCQKCQGAHVKRIHRYERRMHLDWDAMRHCRLYTREIYSNVKYTVRPFNISSKVRYLWYHDNG